MQSIRWTDNRIFHKSWLRIYHIQNLNNTALMWLSQEDIPQNSMYGLIYEMTCSSSYQTYLVVSLNRLSVGCGTKPRRQSGESPGFWMFIRVIYTMLPSHGHWLILPSFLFLWTSANLYFYLFCVNISLILNSFYNRALFDKKLSLFNVYVIRVGLNNAATSRILVNPAVIRIL